MQGGIFKYLTLIWPACDIWYGFTSPCIPLCFLSSFPALLPFPAHSNFLDVELPNKVLVCDFPSPLPPTPSLNMGQL